MEKRLLLAFVLSFMVLALWSAINPPPKTAVNSQVVVNKEVVDNEVPEVKTTQKITPVKESEFNEDIVVLENDLIKAEFTNVGGTIKKIIIKKFDLALPITKIYHIVGLDKAQFILKEKSAKQVVYLYQDGSNKIQKTYVLTDNYVIKANVQTDKLSNLEIGAYQADTGSLDPKILQSPQRSLFEYSVGLVNKIVRKDNAFEFHEKENKSQADEVNWVGFRNQYFCTIVKPDFKSEKFDIVVKDKKNLDINIKPAVSNENNYSANIYAGPQDLKILSSYSQKFEQILVFSNWGLFDIFAKMIYFFVHFLHGILKSWGFSIILLGITLYVVTYPLTVKSMTSMRKMQVLQPKMKALQEKYKNDPQRMNKEMMELYKEHQVNPFGGCLPMLLQMPIFYGLYQVLWRSESFKGAGFFWIKDLSEPDRLAKLPFTLPFLGNELNILPLLMALIMFFQQKYSMKNMVVTDETQMMQQKMMLVMMPVMMGFIFYHFASGLSLYFTVFYLLSTLTQWKMSKVKVEVVS